MQDNTINPQNQNQTTNPVVGPPPDITPTVPTEIPPVPPSSPIRRRALVPTILGLVLLVVGVGAGLLLVQQQQLFKQKAAYCGSITLYEKICSSNSAHCTLLDEPCDPASEREVADGSPPYKGVCKKGPPQQQECITCAEAPTICRPFCEPGVSWLVYEGSCSGSGGGTTQPPPTTTTTSGGKACDGTCSDYCAGADQCASQGGRDVGRGCTIGACSGTAIHCFIPAACQGGGGGGPAPAPTLKACGNTCTSDSECRNPSANGSTVRCIGGTCQNTSCVGKTIPGANCDCSSLNACGQGCSATVGLCQSGSTCRYVVGSGCANNPNPASPTNTYCVPNTLPTGWTTTNCVARDQGNSFILNASGANPTVAEIQQSCAPAPTASCTSITAYDTSWNPLTAAQLSALKPGTTVRFTVAGTTTSGVFDKARFTINGNQQAEVTTKRPNSVDFYQEYVIPAGVTSFTVTSQIHHQALNQWF